MKLDDSEVEVRARKVIRAVILNATHSFEDSIEFAEFDSISRLTITFALEDEFGIQLSPEDVIKITDEESAVGVLRALIEGSS